MLLLANNSRSCSPTSFCHKARMIEQVLDEPAVKGAGPNKDWQQEIAAAINISMLLALLFLPVSAPAAQTPTGGKADNLCLQSKAEPRQRPGARTRTTSSLQHGGRSKNLLHYYLSGGLFV